MNRDRRSQARVIVYRAQIPESNALHEVEYSAIADALHFACRDLREGRRTPLEILEDGVQIYDAVGIASACKERMEGKSRGQGLGERGKEPA